MKINIKEQDVGKRIDAFLAGNTEYSRAHIQKMIENEKVLVNGNKTKVSYKVQKDDEINLEVEVPKEIALEAQEIPIDVLYEDNERNGRSSCKWKSRWNIGKCSNGNL